MMSKFLGVLFGIVIVMSCCFWVGSYYFPAVVSEHLQNAALKVTGFEKEIVETEFGDVHYLVGGQGQTVVLIHGIFARKEHWLEMASKLTDTYRVVILDLPGFGENSVLPQNQYSYHAQVRNLLSVIQALEIDSAHFGVNSMGAQIIGMIAVTHPGLVRSIAFIGSPVGVSSPEPSAMELAIESGRQPPLVVKSEADFHRRMDWLFPNGAPYIPMAIATTWAQEEAARANDNERIWNEVTSSKVPMLEALASEISQPTLLLWCREDQIFHVSGREVLRHILRDSRVAEVTNCGHVPMLDKPSESAEEYGKFLTSLSSGSF